MHGFRIHTASSGSVRGDSVSGGSVSGGSVTTSRRVVVAGVSAVMEGVVCEVSVIVEVTCGVFVADGSIIGDVIATVLTCIMQHNNNTL